MLPGTYSSNHIKGMLSTSHLNSTSISGFPNLANAPGGNLIMIFHLLDALPPIPFNGPKNPPVVQSLCLTNHSCCYRMHLLLSTMWFLPAFRFLGTWARSTQCSGPGGPHPWHYWHLGMDCSLLGGCPMHCRTFSSICGHYHKAMVASFSLQSLEWRVCISLPSPLEQRSIKGRACVYFLFIHPPWVNQNSIRCFSILTHLLFLLGPWFNNYFWSSN